MTIAMYHDDPDGGPDSAANGVTRGEWRMVLRERSSDENGTKLRDASAGKVLGESLPAIPAVHRDTQPTGAERQAPERPQRSEGANGEGNV